MITTIVLTVSRSAFVFDALSKLELLDCDPNKTNILCVVDGNNKLYISMRNLIQKTKFKERLTVHYPSKTSVKNFDIMYRRRRIADIHNFAKKHIENCDYVLLTEDDTIIPANSLKTLQSGLESVVGAVSIEGVEVGRWGIPYIGAWKFNDIYNPTSVTSLDFKKEGVEEIDAGGFYCTLMKASVYKDYEFNCFESLGPDVTMGLDLRRLGYINLIDWSIKCKHMKIGNGGVIESLYPDDNTKSITMIRKNSNSWQIDYKKQLT